MDLEPYWEAVRKVYKPFESGLPSPTGRVYDHEIPGGQLSNLRQQAMALGLGEKFEQIEAMYTAANRILGRPTKVTPRSKVVGDLALHLVAVGADPKEFEENPADVRHPRLGHRLPARRAGRPARRLAGAVPDQGARRAARCRSARRRCPTRTPPSSTRRARRARPRSTGCSSRRRRRSSRPTATRTATSAGSTRSTTCTACSRARSTSSRIGRGVSLILGPRGDRRRRRARHADGHVHDQRAAAPDPGPRHVGQGRRQGRREGRHVDAGPRRRAVRRRGQHDGRRGRRRSRPAPRSRRSRR